MRTGIVTAFGILAAAIQGAGAAQEPTDVRPLLRIHTVLETGAKECSNIPRANALEQDLFVTGGGVLYSTRVLADGPEGDCQFRTRLIRGAATGLQLLRLQKNLERHQIGLQTDCGVPGEGGAKGRYEVTWYGKDVRHNSFRVVIGGDDGSLPPCPIEIHRLFTAISNFEQSVSRNPDSEVQQ
jgi:hypothetical protein